MKVIKLKNLSKSDYQRIIQRSFGTNKEIIPKVKKIIDEVKLNGDKPIFNKYQNRFGVKNYQQVKVTKEEIKKAYQEVDDSLIIALKQMIKNITAVHQAQLPKKIDTIVYPKKGISVWRVWRPIEKVGLYVPGGKAIYPSSVLMTAIPAQIAGCKEIVMCSPPGVEGQIPAPTLVAADLIGLKKIFKVGGVEAIAAFAYGTESISKVYKIFGAGNAFVTAAKMLVFREVAIDMPAGPSEIFIIADATANPKFVASDLLADGEHGPDSACVLLTTSNQIAEATIKEIDNQLSNLITRKYVKESINRYGLFALVDSINEAIQFTNEYAPEHLEIMTEKPEKIVEKINNAGSVFLGDWTTKSSGDYATGANHVLPTGGMAKMYPPLGVDAYGKWMQIQRCTKEGLSMIRRTIEKIAEVEQLPAHKNATSIRYKEV
ncbi:histidinol dehydrogenase [Candidatus Gottesmanbacteria bacterium RBG_16_37_8]|uniref:Histidinol dehydrogenase n=1 Tax=Candidatus Gottesmanbacteria bacterium RBG_16_37_8 TaxID=1798371 RepID=A0A1F5YU46_9BACT|nr:MAG: histidinol dehydrogenase [Candidatus Gottesmanbacteria bacterium RBG_16_37_8]